MQLLSPFDVRHSSFTVKTLSFSFCASGAQPSWEQVHDARYNLKDHECDIWLQNFCWKTFVVDDKKVRGKRIILYAAKSLPFKCSNALIEVGYYYDLPKQKVKKNEKKGERCNSRSAQYIRNRLHLRVDLLEGGQN